MSIVQKEAKTGNKIDSKAKYLESIKNQKIGTRKIKVASLNDFETFCNSFYNLPNSEFMIQDMLSNIEQVEGIFRILHNWVQWNLDEKKIAPHTISTYLVCLRRYLHQRGVKFDREDLANYFLKNNTLKMPLKEKKYAGFYSNKDGSAVCTLEAARNKLKICYSTRQANALFTSSFVRHMVDNTGKKISHWD